MTYAAPSSDSYDDGLVHAHEWSRSTPPGGHHTEFRRAPSMGNRTGQDERHEPRGRG